MKTKILRQWRFVVSGGMALVFAGLIPAANSEPPKDAAPSATPPPAAADTNSAVTQSEHKVIQAVPPAKPPPDVKISPALAELIKLVQAGVSEEVILAFINNSTNAFQLTSAEILYLNDLGVSSNVITTMMRTAGGPTSVTPAAVAQKVPETNAVLPPPAPSPATTAAEAAEVASAIPTVTAPLTPPTDSYPAYEPQAVNYFYDSLAPYGSWVDVAGYGWCWQPTVAVVDVSWRPYSHRGRWIYSDCGWYWLSDYSWGWAPFHYGRWYSHPRAGWVWMPGTTWGPAWVSWRHANDYCGWAPLPPEARFAAGFGFSYHGSHVGVGFDFGLQPHHYAFIPVSQFRDYNPSRHLISSTRVKNVYRDSTVINNYIVGTNNTIINEGIGVRRVAAATRTEIRPVQIREHSSSFGGNVRPEVLDKEGSRLVVHHPPLPKPTSRGPETLSRLARPVQHDDLRVASRSSAPALVRTEFERVPRASAAPLEPAARTPRFIPEPTRGSSSLSGRTETAPSDRVVDRKGLLLPKRNEGARTDARPLVTPPAPAPSAPSVNSKIETPRRNPEFLVRRHPGEANGTVRTPTTTQPNEQAPSGTAPQRRPNDRSLPVLRSASEPSPAPRDTTAARSTRPPAAEQSPAPVFTRPQSPRVESTPAPRLSPNYSQPYASPAPTYQPPVRERPPVSTPSMQPQYRAAQPAAPQYAAPQPPRAEIRSPGFGPPPQHAPAQAAPPAPSRPSRSEPAPSSSSSSRPDRNRN
ncbi:MAG: hypothetical protein DME26_15335 [Verrucomicrobia bacterium]|nr:MAG: hypothetical protein DME26_15335 [Verrucomicrobiota bacterium]